jgi:hypothetical protein
VLLKLSKLIIDVNQKNYNTKILKSGTAQRNKKNERDMLNLSGLAVVVTAIATMN